MKILASTRVYETYEDYAASGKFDAGQLKQIFWGFSNGLSPKSISLYADPAFNHAQMECIYMTLSRGATRRLVTFMADPRFDVDQMRELKFCIEDNPPMEALDLVADPKFSAAQMHSIIAAMYMDGVTLDDIRVFAKPEFSPGQMDEARRAITDYEISDEDFRRYTQPEYGPRMLRIIYRALESGKFTNGEIDQFIQICQDNDISDKEKYNDAKLGYLLSSFQYDLSPADRDYLFFNQPFTQRQLYEILMGLHMGLTWDEVKQCADPSISAVEMNDTIVDLLARKRYEDISK